MSGQLRETTPKQPPLGGAFNIKDGIARVTERKAKGGLFNPFTDITREQWQTLGDEYRNVDLKFAYHAIRDVFSSFAPLLIAYFAPEDIKQAFFTSERQDHVQKLVQEIEQWEGHFADEMPLPTFAINIKHAFSETSFTIPPELHKNILEDIDLDNTLRMGHFYYNILNRALMTMLFSEDRKRVNGTDTYWRSLVVEKLRLARLQNINSVHDVVILAAAKILGVQVPLIDKEVQGNWDLFTSHVDEINEGRSSISQVLFSLCVLAAEKVEIDDSGKLVFTWKTPPEEERPRRKLPIALEVTS